MAAVAERERALHGLFEHESCAIGTVGTAPAPPSNPPAAKS